MNDDDYRNQDGTYDGAALLAALSGVSREEIIWTFNRLKYLRQVEGKSAQEAKRIVDEERTAQPWAGAR